MRIAPLPKSNSKSTCTKVWLAVLLLCWPPAVAASLDFSRAQYDQSLTLTYKFTDPEHNPVELKTEFTTDNFIHTPVLFRPLSPHRLQRDVRQRLLQVAVAEEWNNIRIQQTSLGLRIEAVSGPSIERERRTRYLREQQQHIEDDVLAEAYYVRLREHTGREGYVPDHVRIARESRPALQELAESWRVQLGDADAREGLAQLTHWLQQIPYDELENRLDSPGSGFYPPTRLLYENRGDCDSKVTLLGALFGMLYPDISSRIVYLPGHAVFATAVDVEEQDIWVRNGEEKLVVADPTGPALLPPGQVAARYEPHLRSGAVVARDF